MAVDFNISHADIVKAIPANGIGYQEFADKYNQAINPNEDLKGTAVAMWALRNTIPYKHQDGFIKTCKSLGVRITINGERKNITKTMLQNAKMGSA